MRPIVAGLVLALVGGCGGGGDDTGPIQPGTVDTDTETTGVGEIEVTELGDPMWTVQDVTVFAAPAEVASGECVLGTDHHFSMDVFGPGLPHLPPYGSEVSDGAERCGFRIDDTFAAEEYSGGLGVWLGVVLVPKPGNVSGSSPDFDDGDVIYNDRFPVTFDVDVRWNEVIADSDHDSFMPPPSDFGFVVNGHSHAVLLFRTFLERMPAGAIPEGDYTWNMQLRDATSIVEESGYNVVAPYRVDEPMTGGRR